MISYYGGKFPHLLWLLSKFPKGKYHFVDIMCGAGNVALNVNYPLITINDINDEVMNLFRILRDQHDEFMRLVYFTPFSRAEHCSIVLAERNGEKYPDLERARRYFIKSQLGYGANGSQNNHYGVGFEWMLHTSNYYRVDNWNFKLKKLGNLVEHLRHFQIEQRDALELFDDVNHKGSIVYFDPPYLLNLRKAKKRYTHEVPDDFHRQLAEKVKGAECFVAISGYDSPLYDEIFKDMYKVSDKSKRTNTGKILTKESLWTNYDTTKLSTQGKLKF
jgi:DNA adenine methylase